MILKNDRLKNLSQRTIGNFWIKVRFKSSYLFCAIFVFNWCISIVSCNRPPRFLIDGQTEIVLRLKEGDETPVGSFLYKLRGHDPDGDKLQFGIRQQSGSDVIRIESLSSTEANIYLNQELDREIRDEYALVLTLTDGRLGQGNYITQSLLLLVEDVNDNIPIFKSYPSTIMLREDASPGVVATLEATDADEGAYGQVVYHLQELEAKKSLFTISTSGGKGIVRLIGALDYERQTLHQLKVLAVDRAKQGTVNTGTAAILIKVDDVEDQPPEFVHVQPVARVAEDAPIGTSVLKVTAVDGDRGVNNEIAYSLRENNIHNEADVFNIDRSSGVIFTTSLLDREAVTASSSAYILQIIATEVGGKISPAPTAITEVTVMITDVNDETPKFRSKKYECEISENSPMNTPLTFLNNAIPEVFDYDQGQNGTFQLQIIGAENIFEVSPNKIINEATFIIRVKNASYLDFEQVTRLNFTLAAREIVKEKPKYSLVPVHVNILDRNDNFPEFTKDLYEVTVPENCEIGTTIAWVQALDDDSDNYGTRGVRYTNLAGSIQNLLFLHPISGVISVKISGGPSWDREQVSRHYLTVEARDDLGKGNRNSVQLIINIEDVNDNPPMFNQVQYEARLLENELDFDIPLKVEARDADLNGTKNSEIEYSLFGELMNNFSIDSINGIIKPLAPLDFEKLDGPEDENVRTLHLTIRATDWGTPNLSNDVPLIIYVQDANDFAPFFEYVFYNKSIPEDTLGGTPILQVKAYDYDGSSPNNRVIYRIQNGASDKFVIGAETGIISVAPGASLDPDLNQPKRMHYSLTVLALDSAPGQSQMQAAVTVNISIMDVNNKAPSFEKVEKIQMPENLPVGTEILTLKALDLDSTANLRYKLDSSSCEAKSEHGVSLKMIEFDCGSLFSLEPISGLLSLAKQLDREITEIIHVGVLAEDVASENGPQIVKTTITLDIQDVNDNNPKFRKSYYRFSITENSKNGVNIGNIIADDADKNRTIVYALEGPKELRELLHLDQDTGELLVANRIDHEIYNWMNLTVKATDSGFPPRSNRVELFIQVLDENDNNPYFLPEPRNLSIPEDVKVGETIAVLQAKDADSGEYGKITYLLDRLSSEGKFSLHPDTGVLKVLESLDRETKQSFLLIVEAWDNYQYGYNSGESRNAFKHINVTIKDVNDNAPQIELPETCVSITEYHEIGQSIIMIHANDADDSTTTNGQVILDISDGNQEQLFSLQQINSWLGELTSIKSLKGKYGNYTLTIRAQDLGTPSHLTEKSLNICITDFNDHAPLFLTPPHNSTLKVPENATIGSALVQIIAKDADIGPNGAVRYRLKADPAGHWKTFNLQPVSGILELRLPLDRNVQKIYDIRIEAYDLGIPTPLSSDLDLTVYISSINDYRPQFMVNDFSVNFTENKLIGSQKRILPQTTDRDEFEVEGPPTPICYFIISGNEQNIFKLNPITHELTTNRELDREKKSNYTLIVKATDDCSKVPSSGNFFDSLDDTMLTVLISVLDVNDNPPKFTRRVFTGGVSTATNFGTEFMFVKAEDPDEGINAEMNYYIIGKIQMTLTEGLENLQRSPFLVDQKTGAVQLNFDPQQGMKGYFDFMVMANDTDGLQDTARVFIYLLREDQRVRFVLRQHSTELRNNIEMFREILGNVTGAIVNVDEFRVHANHDGTIDKTKTDLYLHLVDKKDNSIFEVDDVLRIIDQNTEKLDLLFKDFNVLDTQPGGTLALQSIQVANSTFWLTSTSLFLSILLFLCLALCINQRFTYQRKLKAATATAYVSGESEIDGRGISALSGRVPNTNKHSVEGSNPIWLKAYENEWYKNADEISQSSDRDSLDENVVSCSVEEDVHCSNVVNHNRAQNVYQTLPPAPPPRKLETTEL